MKHLMVLCIHLLNFSSEKYVWMCFLRKCEGFSFLYLYDYTVNMVKNASLHKSRHLFPARPLKVHENQHGVCT